VLEVRCRWCGHGRAIETFDGKTTEAPQESEAQAEAGGPPA